MRKLVLVVALACAGCATQRPMAWARADGKPFAADALSLNQTICQGDMQKANLSGTGTSGGYGRGTAVVQVFDGCMAEHGFVRVPAD